MRYYFNGYAFSHMHYEVPGDYSSGVRYLVCKECVKGTKVDKNGTPLFKWSYDTPPSQWNVWHIRDDHSGAANEQFREHAKSHKIEACDECGYFMRRSAMKRHQRTLYCKTHAHAKRLREEGFERFWHRDGYKIEAFFENKQKMLTIDEKERSSLPLKAFTKVVNARAKVEYKLKRDIKWRKEPTLYVSGGWGRAQRAELDIWVDKDFAAYFTLVSNAHGTSWWDTKTKRYVVPDDTMARLIEFASSKKSHREAMICMAELANEATNG